MYRTIARSLRSCAVAPASSAAQPLAGRQLHLGARQARQLSGHPVSLTQGHTTRKARDPMHKDADIQSEGVVKADKTRERAGTGAEPGFDTAKEGGHVEHAEAKEAEGTGSLKDHRGDQQKVGKQGEMGHAEESAGGSTGDSLLKAVGLGGKKTPAEKKGKGFHTSARASMPEGDKLSGARQPAESKPLHGDQNQHLKHSNPSTPDSGKGNAGPSPSLPSKQGSSGSSSSSSQGQKRSLHTTAAARADSPGYVKALEGEPNSKGKNTPPTGLPQELGGAYDTAKSQQPPSPDAEPSSKVDFSSTATATPNEALRQAAKDGTLAERNEQPDTPKYGKIGLDDGWKERKHQ